MFRFRTRRAEAPPETPLPHDLVALAEAIRRSRDGGSRAVMLAHVRETAAISGHPDGWLIHHFALSTYFTHATALEWVVRSADAVIDSRGAFDPSIAHVLGEPAYERWLHDVARALSAVGRHQEAFDLCTRNVDQGFAAAFLPRAELRFRDDPDGALADLEAFVADPRLGHRPAVDRMLAYLGRDDVLLHTPAVDLARASRPTLVDSQRRRLLNEAFVGYGLAPVCAEHDGPLTFTEWMSPQLPDSPHDALVTVIVSAFNAASTVRDAVNSLLVQTHRKLHVVIVDDASTDGTAEVARQMAHEDERVEVLTQPENGGPYAARNAALACARGEYITFHDADDWAHPQRIERHLDVMARDSGVRVTRSEWIRSTESGVPEMRRWGMTVAHPNPASVMVARDVIDEVGAFDEVRFGGDSEHWFRLRELLPPASVVQLSLPLGIGRLHATSLTQSGAGAWSKNHYSAVRSAYQLSWSDWHSSGAKPLTGDARSFWAPEEIASAEEQPTSRASGYPVREPEMCFVAVLVAATKPALLDRTLRSLIAQTDGRWQAIVVGDASELTGAAYDPRVTVIDAGDLSVAHQLRIAAAHARSMDATYLARLRRGALLHCDVVEHVLAGADRRGYLLADGYLEDYRAGTIARSTLGEHAVAVLPSVRTSLPRISDIRTSPWTWPDLARNAPRVGFPSLVHVLARGEQLQGDMFETRWVLLRSEFGQR